jgi:hypothetical protein
LSASLFIARIRLAVEEEETTETGGFMRMDTQALRKREARHYRRRNPGFHFRYYGGVLYCLETMKPAEGAKKLPKPGKVAGGLTEAEPLREVHERQARQAQRSVSRWDSDTYNYQQAPPARSWWGY